MPIIKARSSSIISSVDLRGTPTVATPAAGTSTTQIASTAFVNSAVAALVASAPATLDTLAELALALGSDANFATTTATALAGKLELNGGTMTGSLLLAGDPLVDLEAATKKYVDDSVSAITINSTDDVPQGILNLYYDAALVHADISLVSDNTNVLSYDNTTGAFAFNWPTTDGMLEGTLNEYYTAAKVHGDISLNSDDSAIMSYNGSGAFSFVTPYTDKIIEDPAGAINKYFTVQRARDAITAGANINYSGGTISTLAAVWSVNGYTNAVTLATDDISDAGQTNKFYADALARAAVGTKAGAWSLFSYDSTTGKFDLTAPDTTDVAEDPAATPTSGTMYFTQGRARSAISIAAGSWSVISYNATTGAITLNAPDTSGIPEDPNATVSSGTMYYTDARARAALSATTSTGVTFDSATGVIALAAIPNASLVNSSITFNGISIALGGSTTFTSNAVAEGTDFSIGETTPGAADGTNNLYFTNSRVWTALTVNTDNSDALSYDNTTGTITFDLSSIYTDEISEDPNATVTSGTMYFTNQRVWDSLTVTGSATFNSANGTLDVTGDVSSVNGQVGVVVLNTDDVQEGTTNQYFANSLAQAAITLVTDDTSILSYVGGTFTWDTPNTDKILEGSVNEYYTAAKADARIAAASVFDLSDVNTGVMTDGYTLVWSAAQNAFVPQNISVTGTTLNFTGDGSTASFNTQVEISSIENTSVFINGLVQAPTFSYTLTTDSNTGETSIVFDTAPELNDYIMVRVTSTSQLTAGGVLNENSTIDGGTF